MIDFKQTEKEILEFWEKNNIYQKVKEKNKDGEKFYFLQGPPYTSGKLHIGHAWNNSLKDMILRYKRMRGLNVWDRGGYDMHGLPTEHKVQQKLKLKTKEDIEKYGIDKFVKECMDFSIEHANYMNEDLWKLGVWLDHENAYKPITKDFISGEWKFFKEADKQGRLYKGKKVMHWDAVTETALAKHELEYETIRDTSVFLKFKKKDSEDEYFLIWTTTPWTIPFNLAIMANPDVDYVKLRVKDETWIMAKDLVEQFMSALLDEKFEIVEEMKGKDLEGQEYEHIFYDELKEVYDELKKESPKVHTVILSKEYVDTSAGTGLVHCAPGCGPEDQEAAAKYGIEAFNTLNEKGEFENLGKFTGWLAKEDDKKFIAEFDKKGVLIAKTQVEHEYPHSWRSRKPVIFRTTEQWFLKIEDLADELVEMNKEVHWVPEKTRANYDNWTKNLKDNSVARQRYWGCPIPIWVNENNGEDYMVIGSADELENLSGKKFDDLNLHRPWIDEIIIEKDGKRYRRIPDVADVWIDSGTTSWNCLYNDEKLIKEYFPADLILEATEQTRLWYSLLQICSAIVYGKGCYKNVFSHGMILDFQGVKMSKSLGNVISPYEVVDKFSADIFRYYICQINAGENINFSWEDIKVKQRNLIVLENIANYIIDLEKQNLPKEQNEIEEKWILSRYHNTLKRVTNLFEEYNLDSTIGEIENLFLSLSRDYIKFVRDKSNSAVFGTLREVYLGILKMFSTVCPFVSEYLWRKMGNEESIHLSLWPKADESKIDEDLEKQFDLAIKIIEAGLSERDRQKVGLKWPLAKARVKTNPGFDKGLNEIIKRQLNVKDVEISEGELNVELDLELTPELEAEGFAREISRRVQAERKNRGLQKTDSIKLEIAVGKRLQEMLEPLRDMIKQRTGSESVDFVTGSDDYVSFKVKEEEVRIKF